MPQTLLRVKRLRLETLDTNHRHVVLRDGVGDGKLWGVVPYDTVVLLAWWEGRLWTLWFTFKIRLPRSLCSTVPI